MASLKVNNRQKSRRSVKFKQYYQQQMFRSLKNKINKLRRHIDTHINDNQSINALKSILDRSKKGTLETARYRRSH